MNTLMEVTQYITDTVVQSYIWDNADIKTRRKAVNRAELILRSVLGDIFGDGPIPVEALGEQAMWVLKLDDTIERADFGMKNVWVDGTMITISDKDNSVNPLVFRMLGIPTTSKGTRRRVGGYNTTVGDTGRWGNRILNRYSHRSRDGRL